MVVSMARSRRRGGKLRLDRGTLRWWLLVIGLAWMALAPQSIPPLRFAVGLGLAFTGAMLHVAAKGCLWQNRRLCTAGPYRWSRNPFYLANLLAETGLLIVIGQLWLAVAYLIAWWIIYARTIASEEAVLAKLFKSDFGGYCLHVPRLLPRPWRRLPAATHGPAFSWSNPNLLGGAEYRRATRLLAFPWLLWLAAELGACGPAALVRSDSPALLAATAFLALCAVGEIATWAGRRTAQRRLGRGGGNQYSPASL